jgi:hypothetical protein
MKTRRSDRSRFNHRARGWTMVLTLLFCASVSAPASAVPAWVKEIKARTDKKAENLKKDAEKLAEEAKKLTGNAKKKAEAEAKKLEAEAKKLEEEAKKVFQAAKDGFNTLPAAEFNHKYQLMPVEFVDPTGKIKKTESLTSALKIEVAPNSTGFPGGIGKIVHKALFASYPRFTFKVNFACADADLLGKSDYANPVSIWYNVFLGYYEIDVPKALWGRPFGYASANPNAPLRYDDLLRLGKSDWNHFSNQLYGVPAAKIAPYDQMPPSPKGMRRREIVGSREWDLVDVSNMQAVGAYPGGQKFVDIDPVAGPVWRYLFGTFDKTVPGHTSFEGTSMQGRFYMSFKEEPNTVTGEPSYKTFMFGGTVNEAFPDKAENERFLDLQMEALRRVMTKESGIGFAPTPDEQRNGMNTCGKGKYMTGLRADQNKYLCEPGFGVGSQEAVDLGTQSFGMHACPVGSAMTGLNIAQNKFSCAKLDVAVEPYVDPDTQRAGMHACPHGSVLLGVRLDQNRFLCGRPQVASRAANLSNLGISPPRR